MGRCRSGTVRADRPGNVSARGTLMDVPDRDQPTSQVFQAFERDYAAALGSHVGKPGESGLLAAYELGRRALDAGYSMLELATLHMSARRSLLVEHGLEHIGDVDSFMREALVALELTQRAFVESQRAAYVAHERMEWLRGLSEAYVSIASGRTLAERAHEVCVQAQRFLGAADARLTFGREADNDSSFAGDVITAQLQGSDGRLSVTAPPGRRWTVADRQSLAQLAVLISAPINDARRLEFAQRSGQFGAMLGGATDLDELLARVATHGAAQLGADEIGVTLFDEGRVLDDPPVDGAAATDRAVFAGPSTDGEPSRALLPVDGAEGPLGWLSLRFDDPQPFDVVQRSFLADVSNRLAAAVERSQAYERERSARERAEWESKRFQHLQQLAASLSRATTRRRVAQILLHTTAASTSAVGGLVAVGRRRGGEVLATAGVLATLASTDIDELVAHVLNLEASQIPVAELPPPVRDRLVGVHTVRASAITVGSRRIGLLLLAFTDGGIAAEDDELLHAQIAVAGPTLQRAARYDVEHDIAETLQHSILSPPALRLPQIRWKAHYHPGGVGLVGGDWYDLIGLDDHRVAIVIGDVVGRGIEAAAAMGQLRSATRALTGRVDDPADLIAALDEFTTATGQGRYSTLALAVFDTRRHTVTHAIAGHPPPVLRLPDGSTSLLDTGRGPLVGVASQRQHAVLHLPPGRSQVVLYTDGLVEHRGEPLDVGIERLTKVIADADHALDPGAMCRLVIDQLIPFDTDDDVAIVIVEFTA